MQGGDPPCDESQAQVDPTKTRVPCRKWLRPTTRPGDLGLSCKRLHQYRPNPNLKRQRSHQPEDGDNERGRVKQAQEQPRRSARGHRFDYERGAPSARPSDCKSRFQSHHMKFRSLRHAFGSLFLPTLVFSRAPRGDIKVTLSLI